MNSQHRGMFCKRNGNKCAICDPQVPDSAQHVLLECPRLEVRDIYMGKLIQAMPTALALSFTDADTYIKTYMLLSAYGCKYPIDEWLGLYSETACFIYRMYAARKEAYTQLDELMS